MSDEKDRQLDKMLGALGTLERATEFRTFLLLACFTIALNISLTLTHQTNLAGITWEYVRVNFPIGQALIFLTGFTLFMSLVAGVLRFVIDELLHIPVIYVAVSVRRHLTSADERPRGRPTDMVRPYELLIAARKYQDDTYLEQYNIYQEKKDVSEAAAWRTASLSFALLLLLLLDVTLPVSGSISANFVRFLNAYYNHLGDFIAVLVVMTLVGAWLYRFFENNFDKDWLVCPRLYAKLEDERCLQDEKLRVAAGYMHT
jgi:hypothetical protein